MTTQIRRIAVHQTSKVFAIMYFVLFLLSVPVGIGVLALAPSPQRGMGIFLIFLPVIYAIVTYLGVALFSAIYNLLAARVGGIEFELTERQGAV